jgi:hypothetical protein
MLYLGNPTSLGGRHTVEIFKEVALFLRAEGDNAEHNLHYPGQAASRLNDALQERREGARCYTG